MFQSVLYGKRYKPKELIDADKRQKKYNSNRVNEAIKFRLPLITGSYPKIRLLPQLAWDIKLNVYENDRRETSSKPIAVAAEGNIACIY